MFKTRLSFIALSLLISSAVIMAEPVSANYSGGPEPVYGWKALEANAEYPSITRGSRCDAAVVLRFRIDKLGKVSNIQVSQSGGAPYDEAAMEAVARTKWNPAMQNGHATAVTYELPFQFCSK